VVGICDFDHHRHELATGFIPLGPPVPALHPEPTPDLQPTAMVQGAKVTVDVHTRTGLIGRRDLDVTLASLRLDAEVIDGYLDIYAVVRALEPGVPNFRDVSEFGKDVLFKMSESWVAPSGSIVNHRKCRGRTK
jgi:hypothetical protein